MLARSKLHLLVVVAVSCSVTACDGAKSSGSSNGAGAVSSAPTTVDAGFTGCGDAGPPFVTQKGRSSLLVVFQPGTNAAALDTVANGLTPSTKAGIQVAIQSGVAGVEQPICNPPEIRVEYRSAMGPADQARLRASLLSLPGAIRVQPG